MKVAIVGLGLIGGSLARDLAAAGHEVVAYDRDDRALRAARRARVIVGVLPATLDGAQRCDACVIAVPVDATVTVLRRAATALKQVPLVTDVGSTKASIMRAARSAGLAHCFVGAHPMAGDHRSGWRASRAGLFAGQRVYLTFGGRTNTATLRRAQRFWRTVGGQTTRIDARAHDRLVAAASHLPQVTAMALAATLADNGIQRSALGRGGRDATRLAASSSAVWTPILADNRRNVVPAIRTLARALQAAARAIDRDDKRALGVLFRRSEAWVLSTTGRPL